MLTKEDLQQAITFAAKGGLLHGAFRLTPEGWRPRPDCLTTGYSSGEAVVCSILLAFYFEFYGRPDYVELPADRDFDYPTDLIWRGGRYFVDGVNRMSELDSWAAIKSLLPG